MTDAILTLNAGSSSIKFALFHRDDAAGLRGEIEGLGESPTLTAKDANGKPLDAPSLSGDSEEAVLSALLDWLGDHLGGDSLAAVGHRVVHGGEDFSDPVLIDEDVLRRIEALTPLAPLHQPKNVAPIRAMAKARPELRQVACFDTAFHRTMPAVAKRVALPPALGIRRYGMHGLSYQYIAGQLRSLAPTLAAGRVVVAHLGSGASLCALLDGASIETTMGFSVLDGLVMGTRPGHLDPGILLHLLQARGMTVNELEDLLYHKSGLLGLSGESADMRKLATSGTKAARDAIELFAYRVAAEVGALAAALGGVDGFVFTAGIGEHNADVRAAVADRLAFLGAHLDPARNAKPEGDISAPGSHLPLWVIPTDEESVIASGTRDALRNP